MGIWSPTDNEVSRMEALEERVWNNRFWIDYLKETDEEVRENMFENWVDPLPDADRHVMGNVTSVYDEAYQINAEKIEKPRFDSWGEDPNKIKDWPIIWAIEAKQRTDGSVTTLLSKEVFQELMRFERWLYFDLEYCDVPGIPSGDPLYGKDLMFDEKPECVTWYDMCNKEEEETLITIWPEDIEVPYYCRRNP